jgi:hypothetical protein
MIKIINKILIAAGVASVIEGIVLATYSFFGGTGPDGPDAVSFITIYIFHCPGLILSDALNLNGAAETAIIVSIGFLQYFFIAILAVAIWSKRQ